MPGVFCIIVGLSGSGFGSAHPQVCRTKDLPTIFMRAAARPKALKDFQIDESEHQQKISILFHYSIVVYYLLLNQLICSGISLVAKWCMLMLKPIP